MIERYVDGSAALDPSYLDYLNATVGWVKRSGPINPLDPSYLDYKSKQAAVGWVKRSGPITPITPP